MLSKVRNRFRKGSAELIVICILGTAICIVITYIVAFLQFNYAKNDLQNAVTVVSRTAAMCSSKEEAENKAETIAKNVISNHNLSDISVEIKTLESNDWMTGECIKVTVSAKLETINKRTVSGILSSSNIVVIENHEIIENTEGDEKYILDYLENNCGLSRGGAIALMSNISWISEYDPDKTFINSYGLCAWSDDRLVELVDTYNEMDLSDMFTLPDEYEVPDVPYMEPGDKGRIYLPERDIYLALNECKEEDREDISDVMEEEGGAAWTDWGDGTIVISDEPGDRVEDHSPFRHILDCENGDMAFIFNEDDTVDAYVFNRFLSGNLVDGEIEIDGCNLYNDIPDGIRLYFIEPDTLEVRIVEFRAVRTELEFNPHGTIPMSVQLSFIRHELMDNYLGSYTLLSNTGNTEQEILTSADYILENYIKKSAPGDVTYQGDINGVEARVRKFLEKGRIMD